MKTGLCERRCLLLYFETIQNAGKFKNRWKIQTVKKKETEFYSENNELFFTDADNIKYELFYLFSLADLFYSCIIVKALLN